MVSSGDCSGDDGRNTNLNGRRSDLNAYASAHRKFLVGHARTPTIVAFGGEVISFRIRIQLFEEAIQICIGEAESVRQEAKVR